MTADRRLKRIIRERMATDNVNYTTARRRVLTEMIAAEDRTQSHHHLIDGVLTVARAQPDCIHCEGVPNE